MQIASANDIENRITIYSIRNIFAILLIWWSTFPFFSYYARTIGFLILLVFWFVFSGIATNKVIIFSILKNSKFLLIHILFLLILLFLGHGSNMLNYIWSMIIVLVYISIYSVYRTDYKNQIVIFRGFMFGIVVTAIITVSVLLTDPTASRILLSSVENEVYSRYGVGHFSFIYTLSILAPIMLNKVLKGKKIVDVLLLALFIFTIIMASYAIATLFTFMLFLLVILLNLKHKLSIILLSSLILGIVLLIPQNTWYSFVDNITNFVVKERFYDLLDFVFYGTLRSNSSLGERVLLYRTSIDGFIESPLFGQGAHFGIIGIDNLVLYRIGGHSEIFDSFARFGLFFSMPLVLFIATLLKTIKHSSNTSYIIMLIFILFIGLFNPILTLSFYAFIIILPFMRNTYSSSKKRRTSK